MGRKDKHKQGQSRNNPVFKVANGKLAKHKGKAKEVTTKLKNVSYMIDMILIYFTLYSTENVFRFKRC
jgi:hypothetical protein